MRNERNWRVQSKADKTRRDEGEQSDDRANVDLITNAVLKRI